MGNPHQGVFFLMDDQVIELYKQCGNGGLVAKQLGLTNYKVYAILRKNGIEPKKVGGKEKATIEQMTQAYNNGLSCTQVARQFGLTSPSVVERLQNAGIHLRSKQEALELCGHTKIKRSDEQKVIDLYEEGLSYRDIACLYDSTTRCVERVLKKHSIEPRDNFGSNNPAWKGGKVPLNKLIRNSQKYTDFVKHIMASRDYTCELTGQRGNRLNVHHIKPFSQLVDEFMIRYGHISDREQLMTTIETYTPFWEESNVLLVTEEEHKKIHSSVLSKGV